MADTLSERLLRVIDDAEDGCDCVTCETVKEAAAELDRREARLTALEQALTDAIQLIRTWHGTELDEKDEALGWNLYQQSPEMKRIAAALKG